MLDLAVFGMIRGVARPVVVVRGGGGVGVVLVEVERVGRRGGVGEGAVRGGRRGGDVGHEWCGNAAGVEVKLWKCVYPLPSPYKHTNISHSNPGMGSPRRDIRVHGSRLVYLCYEQVVNDERWRGTIDGLATVLFACRGVHEHGHGR